MQVDGAAWVVSRDGRFLLAWQVGGDDVLKLFDLTQQKQVPLEKTATDLVRRRSCDIHVLRRG